MYLVNMMLGMVNAGMHKVLGYDWVMTYCLIG